MTVYVIWDEGDDDFHYGDGVWGHDIDRAQEYLSIEEAEEGMEDVDGGSVFHGRSDQEGRFHILSKKEEP